MNGPPLFNVHSSIVLPLNATAISKHANNIKSLSSPKFNPCYPNQPASHNNLINQQSNRKETIAAAAAAASRRKTKTAPSPPSAESTIPTIPTTTTRKLQSTTTIHQLITLHPPPTTTTSNSKPGLALPTIISYHTAMRYNAQEGTQTGLNSCCLPRLFLYLIAAAAIGLNAYTILNNINESEGKGATRIAAAINQTATNATNVIELQNSAIRATTSDGDDFFDCNHSQSKCEYFYPGKFFQHYFSTSILQLHSNDTKSTASEQEHEQYTEWGKKIGLANGNLPALDSLSWWTMDDDAPGAGDNRRDYNQLIQSCIHLPRNITYIHVHKCGGTSIQGALYKRARRIKKMQFRTSDKGKSRTKYKQHLLQMNSDVHTYKHSFGGGSREKKAQRDESRVGHIQAIANFQAKQQHLSKQHSISSFPIFTVIRDPIQRFLSATQQVMHYNTDFREKCLKEYKATPSSIISSLTSSKNKEEREAPLRRQTIQCAIQDMKETTYRKDVHLLPIASHFRLLDNVTIPKSKDGVVSRDVAVSVFYMKDIKDVLLHLVGDDDNESSNNSSKPITVYHARDRSNVEYATSSILAKLSSSDCSEEMIQQICALYDVDVALMRWLGFEGESTKMCK